MHEPLRLSVFIETARADIAGILAQQPGVRELAANGWLHLFAVEQQGRLIYWFTGNAFEAIPS